MLYILVVANNRGLNLSFHWFFNYVITFFNKLLSKFGFQWKSLYSSLHSKQLLIWKTLSTKCNVHNFSHFFLSTSNVFKKMNNWWVIKYFQWFWLNCIGDWFGFDISFDIGLKETIDWYIQNQVWLDSATSGDYQSYYRRHYGND